MRIAYAVLGLAFLLVLIGAFVVVERAHAPEELATEDPASSYYENTHLSRDMQLTSPAFEENALIPSRFTCDGENINPELMISGIPPGTQSLVLLMDDPDIPESVRQSRGIEKFDHWTLINIPPEVTVIEENSVPDGAVRGQNSAGGTEYRGPCPPDREHRYFFKLYALDTLLTLGETATQEDVELAMSGHVLESTSLMGRYDRQE